ncbi:SHD1 domain-containing protein [Candidatus Riflebacteria bacterium]
MENKIVVQGRKRYFKEQSELFRTWTSRTKAKVAAELVELHNGNIKLRKENGKVINTSIKKLSKEDRKFIEKTIFDTLDTWAEEKKNATTSFLGLKFQKWIFLELILWNIPLYFLWSLIFMQNPIGFILVILEIMAESNQSDSYRRSMPVDSESASSNIGCLPFFAWSFITILIQAVIYEKYFAF